MIGQSEHIPNRFSTIPLRGKVPLIDWKEFSSRIATDAEKHDWNNKFPGHNMGIITGPISSVFVLDVDGEEGEKSLIGRHVPKTVTVRTPHGRHHYFKWIAELDNKVTTKVGVLNKVDTRGAGGLVAFYGWEYGPNVRPLMAPPQWLIDLLPSKNAPKEIGDSFKKLDYAAAMQNLKEGNRNDTLFKLASSLRARGFEYKEVYETLLPKAKEVGIDERELQTLSQSACKYPAGQRPPVAEDSVSLDSFEQFLQDERPVEYIVPGIFAKNSIAFVAGLPETCKTWTLIDLAIELARKDEGSWLGRFLVKNSKVLYIDQERDKSETQRRFKALMLAKGLQPKDLNDSLVVKCGTSTKINLQHSFDAFKRLLSQVRPSLVLIDSFKAFHSADINSNVQMQEVMEKIKELKNEFGCSFGFIFHENKGAFERMGADGKKKSVTFEHMAGAMVMSEVAETILITVKQDNDTSFLYHVKNTYGQKVAPVLVSVENVLPDKSQIKVIGR